MKKRTQPTPDKTRFTIDVTAEYAERLRRCSADAGYRSGGHWLEALTEQGIWELENAWKTGRFFRAETRIIPFDQAGAIDRAQQLFVNVGELAKSYACDDRSDKEAESRLLRWIVELIDEDIELRFREDAVSLAKFCGGKVETEVTAYLLTKKPREGSPTPPSCSKE